MKIGTVLYVQASMCVCACKNELLMIYGLYFLYVGDLFLCGWQLRGAGFWVSVFVNLDLLITEVL